MEPLLDVEDVNELAQQLNTSMAKGLAPGERMARLETHGRNIVPPPLPCPKWLCCLLPCLMGSPAMKEYRRISPNYATVLRLSREVEIDAADVVPGDILVLRAGDRVAADCRVFHRSEDFAVDASALSNVALTDAVVPMAARVDCGEARAIVVATGTRTMWGRQFVGRA